MDIERVEYVHIKMHEDEAAELVLLLRQIDNGSSNLPDWAKAQSIEFIRKFKNAGVIFK